MSKRKTPGERIALKVRYQGTGLAEYQRVVLASDIDRAIRRAWDQGAAWGLVNPQFSDEPRHAKTWNPYRGRARK